jgi:hypothetical protein
MAGRRPSIEAEEVPRPGCSACGAPAHHRVEITVQELVLERDAGIRARPYWSPSYRTASTCIMTLMCTVCLRRHVTITVAASAAVEKGKVGP